MGHIFLIQELKHFFDCDDGHLMQMIGASGVGKQLSAGLMLRKNPNTLFYDTNYAVFRATILENILVGRTITQTAVTIALNEILPDLHPRIGVECNESELSAGQIQRINFVRNLLGTNGRNIIMDEPLSNIDRNLFEKVLFLQIRYVKSYN